MSICVVQVSNKQPVIFVFQSISSQGIGNAPIKITTTTGVSGVTTKLVTIPVSALAGGVSNLSNLISNSNLATTSAQIAANTKAVSKVSPGLFAGVMTTKSPAPATLISTTKTTPAPGLLLAGVAANQVTQINSFSVELSFVEKQLFYPVEYFRFFVK